MNFLALLTASHNRPQPTKHLFHGVDMSSTRFVIFPFYRRAQRVQQEASQVRCVDRRAVYMLGSSGCGDLLTMILCLPEQACQSRPAKPCSEILASQCPQISQQLGAAWGWGEGP